MGVLLWMRWQVDVGNVGFGFVFVGCTKIVIKITNVFGTFP